MAFSSPRGGLLLLAIAMAVATLPIQDFIDGEAVTVIWRAGPSPPLPRL